MHLLLENLGEANVVKQYWVNGTVNTATQVDGYAYTYDRDGNVTAMVNEMDGAFSENFTYDNFSQLINVSRSGSSYQSFSLDALGNMDSVTASGVTQNRTVNSENQITAIGGASLSYDNNGNTTTDDHGDTLVYDAWNRLVAVKDGSGNILKAYEYDGLGRLISETDGYTTTDLYYSGTQVIEERTGAAGIP